MESFIPLIILLVAGISFVSVIILSASHLMTGETCPYVAGVPACFMLIFFIGMILVSQLNLFDDNNILFFGGAGITLLIAIYASFSHIRGSLKCPKLLNRIPLCYLSLLTFGFLIGLKIVEINS